MNRKINILFRWSPYNHYTIPALIGLLDDKLNPKQFSAATTERIEDIILNAKNDKNITVLAYSFTTPEFPNVKREIEYLKGALGDSIIIICGGPHTTALPDEVLAAGADVVFTGEAEESLPKFFEELFETRQVPEQRIIQPVPLGDFNSYPPFAYKRNFYGMIELRRGCTNRCSFCQTPHIFPHIRERSVEYVMHYAQYVKKARNNSVFFITPDVLSYGSKSRDVNLFQLETLLSQLHSTGSKIHLGSFPSELSPSRLSRFPEAAHILKKYVTNRKVLIGGQSASARVLRIMKRDHTAEDTTNAVKILKNQGFFPIVDILFGIPGENREDRVKTLKFMKMLMETYGAQPSIHYYIPLPGTQLSDKLPEQVEDDIKEEILKMIQVGAARGDFFTQMNISSHLK